MKKVHIVNHTHWDREWYFTTMDALVLSDNLFSQVLEELEKNEDAKFCLDGQSSIVDDYIRLNPNDLQRIRNLVEKKQLHIGPWYTQTDGFFVGEESFIRNLSIGLKDSKKYGAPMMVGYLPDTFGINAQMPTILENCGLDNIVFWRGINFKKHVNSPYFTWRGLGDSEITAINLVDGYGTAAHLNATDDYINERLLPATKKIENLTDFDEILIPSGGDQLEIIKDLPMILDDVSTKTNYEYKVSDYETYLEYLRKRNDLPNYQGEFREPVSTRAHKSIGSVRYDIKHTNFLIEQKLIKRVEPLIAIASFYNIKVSKELLDIAWKKILEGHAHDSMGGCVSDDVAIDILHRMKEADEICDGIENMIVKRLSEKLNLSSNQVIVFNTKSKDMTGLSTVELLTPNKNIRFKDHEEAVVIEETYFEGKIDLLLETPEGPKYINEDPYFKLKVLLNISIPSMGFKVLEIEDSSKQLELLTPVDVSTIENEFYELTFNEKNINLKTNTGIKVDNLLTFVSEGNAGDTYDFSPLKNDVPIDLKLDLKTVEKSSLLQKMLLKGSYKLPLDLEDRIGTSNNKGELEISLEIILKRESQLIEFNVKVNNLINSHRLRVKLDTGMVNTTSIGSLPFGFIERNQLVDPIKNWQSQYVEYPIDIEPFDKSVSVSNDKYHMNAYSLGMKEYQHVGTHIYLTMLATTGQLGKPNLAYRPGRASGDTTKKGHVMIPTPMAQQKGVSEFNFAISINEGVFDELLVSQLYEKYSTENVSYQNQSLNKFIHRLDNKLQPHILESSYEEEFSILSVDTLALDSSLSPSLYDENSFLLRLSNPTKQQLNIKLDDTSKFEKIRIVNCIEEEQIEQNMIVKPYNMITLKLWKK